MKWFFFYFFYSCLKLMCRSYVDCLFNIVIILFFCRWVKRFFFNPTKNKKIHFLNSYKYSLTLCVIIFGFVDSIQITRYPNQKSNENFLLFSGGRFCSFSPCIEQSQRVCEVLESSGFVEIQSMEVLQTEDMVRTKQIPIMDLEFVKHKVRSINNL